MSGEDRPIVGISGIGAVPIPCSRPMLYTPGRKYG